MDINRNIYNPLMFTYSIQLKNKIYEEMVKL
jgi:hypothetical protein